MRSMTRGTGTLLFTLGVVGALGVAPARAQEPTGEPVADRLEAAARTHFELGREHYQAGRFTDAAHEFREAHRLSGFTQLLFNVYLAERDAGRSAEAAEALGRFLDESPEGSISNRELLESRLAALRAQASEPDAPATPPPEHAPPQESPAGEAPRDGAGTSAMGVALLATGGAALVAALGTGITALGARDDLDALCDGTRCPEAARDDRDRGRRLALTTDVLIGVGAAAAVAGTLWLAFGGRDVEATAACAPGGCHAAVRGRF